MHSLLRLASVALRVAPKEQGDSREFVILTPAQLCVAIPWILGPDQMAANDAEQSARRVETRICGVTERRPIALPGDRLIERQLVVEEQRQTHRRSRTVRHLRIADELTWFKKGVQPAHGAPLGSRPGFATPSCSIGFEQGRV